MPARCLLLACAEPTYNCLLRLDCIITKTSARPAAACLSVVGSNPNDLVTEIVVVLTLGDGGLVDHVCAQVSVY